MNIRAAVNLPIARWQPDAAERLLQHDPRERPRPEPDRGRGERVERDDRARPHAGRSCTTCTVTASSSRSTTSAPAIRRSAASPRCRSRRSRSTAPSCATSPASPHANAIATTIIQLARNIGAEALAEGIETPDQCEFLKREGCTLGQGFLFSPAVPADEVEPLYRRFDREPAVR